MPKKPKQPKVIKAEVKVSIPRAGEFLITIPVKVSRYANTGEGWLESEVEQDIQEAIDRRLKIKVRSLKAVVKAILKERS